MTANVRIWRVEFGETETQWYQIVEAKSGYSAIKKARKAHIKEILDNGRERKLMRLPVCSLKLVAETTA